MRIVHVTNIHNAANWHRKRFSRRNSPNNVPIKRTDLQRTHILLGKCWVNTTHPNVKVILGRKLPWVLYVAITWANNRSAVMSIQTHYITPEVTQFPSKNPTSIRCFDSQHYITLTPPTPLKRNVTHLLLCVPVYYSHWPHCHCCWILVPG